MSHYATLNVPTNATGDEIKKAYRRKAKAAHPDHSGGGSHQAMVAVNSAYDTLSDPQKRQHYDETGSDDRTPSLDQLASQLIFQLLMQMMEKLPESTDHVAEATRAVLKNIEQFRVNVAKLEKQRVTIQKRIKLLKFKGKGRNLIKDMLEQRLTQIPEQIRAGEQQVKALERAVEILKEYDWTMPAFEMAPMDGVMWVYTRG